MKACPTVEHVIVYKRSGSPVNMVNGRDWWWHELTESAPTECPAAELDSEDPLYILYTSGTLESPRAWSTPRAVTPCKPTSPPSTSSTSATRTSTGARLTSAGYRHSYVVYGPLQNGATVLMYEARPTGPISRASGRSSTTTRSASSTRAHRHSRLHQVGRPARGEIQARLAAPARTVGEPSTPRRGCGTARRSATTAAPLWIHGGRLRPAHSYRAHPGAVPTKPVRPRGRFSEFSRRSSPRKASRCLRQRRPTGSAQALASMARTVYGDPSATSRLIGAMSPAATLPATARGRTRTATSGSWAASTTSST